MHLRVVTLNVMNTEGNPRRAALINAELRRLDPDLLSLQEVVQTDGVRQLDALLDGLPLHVTHQADVQRFVPPFAEKYGGAAVATRLPHTVLEAVDLRIGGATDVPWATLAIALDLPGAGELLFIGSTASWRFNAAAAREEQALALADLDARHRRTLPTVIAGDFNAAPDAASIRFLTGRQALHGRSVCYSDAWDIAGAGDGYTWTVDNPLAAEAASAIVRQSNVRKRFDYVFVGSWDAHPKARAEIRNATVAFDRPVDGVWLSDHFGLVVDLDVATEN